MKCARLEDMVRGWFVGDFSPTAAHSTACEVAVKHYRAGDHEATHHHRVATEITLIISGRARMMGREWSDGDIVVIEPGEATDFSSITDVTSVVVKLPSATGDKYPGQIPPSESAGRSGE